MRNVRNVSNISKACNVCNVHAQVGSFLLCFQARDQSRTSSAAFVPLTSYPGFDYVRSCLAVVSTRKGLNAQAASKTFFPGFY